MRTFILLVFSLLLATGLMAQKPSRQDLEKQRSSLLREISATQDQLAATRKDRNVTVGQLRALNRKLSARETLISNINSELGNISNDITGINTEIQSLNQNLSILKTQYARSVRYAYKHKTSQNLIAFLFSANSFNDALRRMQYLKRYRDYRQKQADKIRETQKSLKQNIAALNGKKEEKGKLLQTEEDQKSKILEERGETDKMVQELKGREGELMAQIKKNQQTANRIQAAIKAEIQREVAIARAKAEEEARRKAAEEARRRAQEEAARKQAEAAAKRKADAEALARKKAAEDARKRNEENGSQYSAGSNQTVTLNTGSNSSRNKPIEEPIAKVEKPIDTKPSEPAPTSYKLSLTPEVKALSEGFANNRGRLPWPVSKGFISSPYGTHPHPVYSNVMVENNGIDISTGAGAPVMSVFGGTVIKVVNINGYVVMISHGEYFTVYSNLASVSVSAGSKVSTKQVIGTAGVNSDGESLINFQIWKVGANNSSSTVNPASWIAR